MKTLCDWIGWFVGMNVGLMLANSVPALEFICAIGGYPLGRYIVVLIEKRQEQERKAAERQRTEEELAWKKKEEEKRNLPTSLPAYVASWSSHSNSSLKHKYFFDYYPYGTYKDNASASMWNTWRTVWHFKNDPDKNVTSYEHRSALQTVTNLVENALRSAFGSKTEYLTLVCLTASTQRKKN